MLSLAQVNIYCHCLAYTIWCSVTSLLSTAGTQAQGLQCSLTFLQKSPILLNFSVCQRSSMYNSLFPLLLLLARLLGDYAGVLVIIK